MKFWQLYIGLFFGTMLSASAQSECSYVLRGRILDAETHLPIEGAAIWLYPVGKSSVSDDKGQFSLKDLCSGSYVVDIHSLGYKEGKTEILLNASSVLTFTLEKDLLLLDYVEVSAHKESLITTTTVSTLSGKALEDTRGGNLAQSLEKMAGVSLLSSGGTVSKPVIHGLHSNRILILNNGVRQEGQQWGSDHAPEIDPFVADEISVVKGAEAVRYGPEAMGGVILLTPKDLPTTADIHGSAYAIGHSNGRSGALAASLEGGISALKGFGWRVQGSTRRAGTLSSPDYYQGNTGLKEANLSGAFGFRSERLDWDVFLSHFSTELGILRDAHTGNISDLEAIIENGRPFNDPGFSYDLLNPKQRVQHQLAKAMGHYHLNKKLTLTAQYAFQANSRQEFDKRRGDLNEKAALDLSLFTQTLDLSLDIKPGGFWIHTFGLSGMNQVNTNIPGTGVTPLIPNYDLNNLGGFAISRFTKARYELEAGLRYDWRQVDAARYRSNGQLQERLFQYQNVTASLGAVYYWRENLSYRTNLGTAWRPPSVNELFSEGLHHGVAAYEQGSLDFVSEKAIKWIHTLAASGDKWSVEATGYANFIQDYIYLQPTENQAVSIRGSFYIFEYQQTDATLWGGDISGRYQLLPAISYEAKASLVRAQNRTDKSNLPWIPTDRLNHGLHWEGNGWGFLKVPSLGINLTHVAKQYRVPSFDYIAAPEAYTLVGMESAWQFALGKNTLRMSLQAQNLLNLSYREYMNRFKYFTEETGRNISLRIKYEF